MQYTTVLFALFSAAAMGEMVKVPRSQMAVRQAGAGAAGAGGKPITQNAAMTDKNGNVLLFDSKNVYKDATAKGQ
ncbi:hypothetical protein F4780DRAFT_776231 [Xylariomycetidae sp. FL0641]|nr:hypothetical protein F4780DRAFT_776231 [Xylariomycetidae sp. FL0641]